MYKRQVINASSSTEKVVSYEKIIKKGIADCFEEKKTRKKTSEPPWISKGMRDNIRRRRAVFRREGRSEEWWRIKLQTRAAIQRSRGNYNREKKERIIGEHKLGFFKAVTAFLGEGAEGPWNVSSMFPGMGDQGIAEEAAAFFNRISSELSLIHI